ncbi:cholesterol 24-hydroxylase isoform 3-T5 [Acridotheres tristis]
MEVLWAAGGLLLALSLLAFLLYCCYVQYIHAKYDYIPGAPRESFLFGHLPIIWRMVRKQEFTPDLFLQWAEKYGPVVRMNAFHRISVLIVSPEGVKVHREWFGNCLQPRALAQAAEDNGSGFQPKVAFGLELNALSDDQTPLPNAVTKVMEGLNKARVPFMRFMPGKQKLVKEVRESVRLLRRVAKECIDRRREAIQNGKEATMDILTQILKGAALEETRDDENILDNFITFFVAGHETSANQMTFTVMALGQHPEILERAQAEVDEVLGAKRDVDYEDLGKLTYLSQILKESLRLYPPVSGTLRRLEKEQVINDITIPANTTVFLNTYIMGRMEKFFKDPLTFDPDRFSKDAPKPYYCYFPFSLGPRSCIGQVFAQMEVKVVMAKLLQRFEFQLVPGQSFKLLEAGTLRPLDGVICKLKPRISARGCKA